MVTGMATKKVTVTTQVGLLLAASRTSDIADAHVVICARRHREPIVTSDPRGLARLDREAALIRV
jgi:hypothetical protein